jgi:hypothetical protein
MIRRGRRCDARLHDTSAVIEALRQTDLLIVIVMAGLVPAIHVLSRHKSKDVDARGKPGHDGGGNQNDKC